MATFEEALKELKKGKRVILRKGLSKPLYMGKNNKIVHDTIDFGPLAWLPSQAEILSEDWTIL